MTTIDTPALLPCPFCGGEAEIDGTTWRPSDGKELCWVTCMSCNAYGPTFATPEAIAAWNCRATLTPAAPTDNTALVEAARHLVEAIDQHADNGFYIYPTIKSARDDVRIEVAALASREAAAPADVTADETCTGCYGSGYDGNREAICHCQPSAAPAEIQEGLCDDCAGLGRFAHHPDPAVDFCIEVETLDSRLHQAENGLTKPGTEPETVAAVLEAICRALQFTVGGDEGAVNAKNVLRALYDRAALAAQPADDLAGEPCDRWVQK